MGKGHTAGNCTSRSCNLCRQRHHTLLHRDETEPNQTAMKERPVASAKTALQTTMAHRIILLPTVLVEIADSSGKFHTCRALLDSGATNTLIREGLAQQLRLKRSYCNDTIIGVGGEKVCNSRGETDIIFRSRLSDERKIYSTKATILRNLTNLTPAVPVNSDILRNLNDIKLGDPEFMKPGRIDLLIESGIFFDSLKPGKIISKTTSMVLQETKFGWVATGKASERGENNDCNGKIKANINNITVLHSCCEDVNHLLKRFWEVENVTSDAKSWKTDPCEKHFAATHQRSNDGRNIVRLPFIENAAELGESRGAAVMRLLSMEKKFGRSEEFRSQYGKFMREYIDLGHMRELRDDEKLESLNILPHHSVFNPQKGSIGSIGPG